MTSSPFPVVVLSDTESDDDAAALSRIPAESFSSSLATQAEVEALCQKHGVPSQFAASPAGERRACTPPPPRAVCVYAHMLEAGLRFPLQDFFSEALFHFGLAPGQLTPNGWRVLVCFVVLCRSAGVPPTIAVFRHFFSLRTRGWCFFRCRKGVGALVTGLTSRKSEKEWKRGFFFLKSPEQWSCPVHWGEPPSGDSIPRPVLSRKDRESVEKLEHTQGVPVDLRTYLSASNLAAAFSSALAGASPAPPLEPFPRSTGMKAEPMGDTMKFSGKKKRKQEEVAGAEPNTPRAPTALSVCLAAGLPSPPGYDPNPRHIPVPDTHDGDSADWGEARKVLESILTPSRQREFAAAKPSDVVASTYLAIGEAMSSVTFSLGHALELEEKQTAQERGAAALREQLEEVKAELTTVKQESEAKLSAVKQESEAKLEKLRAELAAARRAMEAEVESAKTAAVQKFLRSEEYRRRVAGQALPAYEQGAEDMKRVALRLVPSRDAAKLVLPLD